MSDLQNPRGWRYTWETLAHVPTLRLFLFNPQIKPAIQCKNLTVTLKFEESLIQVRWNEEIEHRSDGCVDSLIRVHVPRVLIEVGSPVDFIVTEDHIEVKLVLLLPIDHPLVSNFDSVLNMSDEDPSRTTESSDGFRPLSVGSDIKHMLAADGIDFYCKSCSTKLTKKPLRSFVEIPSVDWREAADNWFGTCCCSFGGISEKLVTKYVSSYACAEGTCLYDATSVIVNKDDLAGYVFPDSIAGNGNIGNGPDRAGESKLTEAAIDSESNCGVSLCRLSLSETTSDADKCLSSDSSLPLRSEKIAENQDHKVIEGQKDTDSSFCPAPLVSEFSGCTSPHGDKDNANHVPSQVLECCSHGVSVTSSNDQDETNKLLRDHQSLLSGSLGSGFMVRTSNISEGVEWIDFRCSQCSYILGAYPSATNEHAPLDGGIRFLKCYISSNLPVSGSDDIFRKYSLQRMFANQLIQNADDELSFRTVVKDLKSNYPMLQLVLLNPNSWYCSGYCSEEKGVKRPLPKVDLRPVIKVLYSESDDASESQSRMIEEWASKNQAGEVYMLNHQITELIESLKSARDRLPFSCSFMQGLTLSFLER